MRSPESRWLLAKDLHELLSSRAYWLLLFATGLLVGHAFLTASNAYAEMSGSAGVPAALAQGLSPLDGIVVPTFGALWLAATLLLPFVAIRVIAHEKHTGAWNLLVQGPARRGQLLLSKLVALSAGWLFACLPAAIALVLWRISGNHLDAAETASVLLGHLLFGWLTIGAAAAAAAVLESESSAAVAALALTIGTWALDFIGADRGGAVGALAKFTPGAVLHSFEHGLVRAGAIVVMITIGGAGLGVATTWLDPGAAPAKRRLRTTALVAAAAGVIAIASQLRATWDVSEDRRNSFSLSDEAAIRRIRQPIGVEIHLAAEDPRLADLRSGVLDKIQRLLPAVDVSYRSRTRTGLFEQADSAYGEVWYTIGSHRVMSRSATPEIVLPLLYQLADVAPPSPAHGAYPGYPLVRRPVAVALLFFVGWPLLLIGLNAAYRRAGRREPAALHPVVS